MKKRILIFMLSSIIISCSSEDGSGQNTPAGGDPGGQGGSGGNNTWLIPISEVRDGGTGKDGIPSIDNPFFTTDLNNASDILSDESLIVGIKIGNEIKAYPHYILDYHEIVNDDVGNTSVAMTYCPLTGTAIAWNRLIEGTKTTFGVSGLIYNNNLIPYDRLTDSNWSQIAQQSVNGELIGKKPVFISTIETTWAVWKEMYPDAKLLSDDTGFDRNYSSYPYGNYDTDHNFLLFPLSIDDNRLPRKERVHALIVNDKAKVYRFSSFSTGTTLKDQFFNKDMLIVGDDSTLMSYELDANTKDLTFEYAYDDSATFFTDNEGTHWNIFGEAISGPRAGAKLRTTESCMAYWFSIGAFFPGAVIYE